MREEFLDVLFLVIWRAKLVGHKLLAGSPKLERLKGRSQIGV
jgi:hypothetical protein